MDYDKAKHYMEEHLFKEFLPHINYQALKIVKKHPERFDSSDANAHQELYYAGLMGLIAAVKNWNPDVAKQAGNSFITHANHSIAGHMLAHVTGHLSHGRPGSIHPHLEKEFMAAEKKQKAEQPVTTVTPPKTPDRQS